MKKPVITRDRVFLVMIIVLVFGICFGFGDKVQTGYVVADCIDSDEDGYYGESCSSEDIGCGIAENLVVDSYDKSGLDIDGNNFVYVSNSKVYSYDFSSSVLLSGELESLNSRIDLPYVVWQSFVGGDWQVYVYDFGTQSQSLVSSSSSHQINPDVYGNIVVWADNVGGDWNIYMKDLVSGQQSMIISGSGNQYSPRIYNDYVVYVDDASGTKDVYLYQLSSGVKSLLDGSSGNQNSVYIFGNYVVWQSNAAGNWDIYGYDLTSKEVFSVAIEDSDEKYPKVSNELIVWVISDGNDFDVMYYDFETKKSYSLTDDGVNQILPIVNEKYVIWLDETNGNYDIFGQEVNPLCDSFMFGDCDDTSSSISPAAVEVCDYLDNDCDDDVDEECGTVSIQGDCLISSVTSNVWVESTWNQTINSAFEGETVFMVSYGDGTCGTDAADFYLYSVIEDSGEYFTDELVNSFTSATMKNYDTYDASYMSWSAEYNNDNYYYFISVLNDTAVLGDTLLVCQTGEDCVGESITVSDASDYLSLYSDFSCIVDDDCNSGESCVDGSCEEVMAETCNESWDCSNVEWSDCENGISTLDLSQCLSIPLSDACYTEEYLPVTEKSCSASTSAAEIDTNEYAETVAEETSVAEEVPVFTWINLLFVVGILCVYYTFRKI